MLSRPILLDLNLDKPHLYPFIMTMHRFDGSCKYSIYLVENVFNKMEDVNLKVFNMIKWINESKKPTKRVSFECKFEFHGSKFNTRQN